jgi:hypothetical protein
MKASTIDVVKKISEKEFKENYLIPQRPVIIKGLTEETGARNWSIEYIKKVCGDVMVDVFDNSNPNNASAFTTPDLKMRFEEYVSSIIKDEPSTLRMFLFNMFKARPSLRKEFPCPKIMKGVMGRVGFMFFGAKGIRVRIHQDMDMSNVLLTQFYGRKKVVLVAPEYSRLLYKLPFNTHSLVNLDKPDYEKYPGLRYIQTQECILEHGDSLFMPSGYWHYITYLDGGFSVSYRKMAHSFQAKMAGFLSLCVYMPFDKLMNRIIGPSWLHKKEKMAERRANRIIKQLTEREAKPVFSQLQTNS